MMKTTMVLMLLCSVVYGRESLDTSTLSDEQIREIKEKVENERGRKSLEKTKEYVMLGEMIGKAISSTARELGTATNDFVNTPVGKMAMVLIIYRYVGNDLIHYGVGFFLLFTTICVWTYLYRREFIINAIDYGSGWWIFRSRKVTFANSSDREGDKLAYAIFLAVFVGLSFIIMFARVP